ncbi:MFS general substrate transporter [Gloeophyllum trabeum ATCC 11539]|uniref:MFS general substrate transporter n=1 Tax=Gloeophyllum trabeum (strain ATCC 11539 / FP-39264 / Madison 617) TaxID=670483 RepID=S7RTX4_GLOTA|nr:MFS general substrate transporter [Gloeophyllum trabeum ATCC 11539]EPQ56604.1 MFS general substrate transporter [Gloeophyllum trabeum ATCC 11539]
MNGTTSYAPSTTETATEKNDTERRQSVGDVDEQKDEEKEQTVTKEIDAEAASPPTYDYDFPDGGWQAWSVVVGSWLVSFSTFGYINAYGVYQDYYQTHQLADYSASAITWIGSLQLAFIFWGGMLTGRLFDKGYMRHLVFAGSVLSVFCLMMTSLAKSYYQILLAQGVGLGLGFGLLYVPAISCISHWFRRRRALANGVLASGSSTGGIVFPIMLNKLANNPNIGYGWAVRATGFVVLGCLLVGNFLLKTRLPRREHGAVLDFSMFKDVTYSIYVVGCFFVLFGIYLPFFFLQQYAIQQGISENIAFYSLAFLNAASLFGRVVPNFVADYVGPLNVLIPACFVTSVLIFIFLAVHTPAGVVVYALVFGFFSGTYVSVIPAGTASLTADMATIGIRIGMSFFVVGFGGLFGSPVIGAIIARQGGGTYWGAAVFSGIVCLIGTAFLVWARQRQVAKTGSWKA